MDLRFSNELEKGLYLGLCIFVATFFLGITRRSSDFRVLSNLLRTAAQEGCLLKKRDNQEVMLWALLLAKAVVFDQSDDAWLIPRIADLVSGLGLQSSGEFGRTLRKFPWINVLHGKPAQEVWRELGQHGSRNGKSEELLGI
jgi:hypothetical protein